ncbi:MAG: hypothetical protein GIW97_00055 [Candidatus Eremiobacteraeota bacterium]|nr:hypothetical protein [Candidatus Eremiobacteraeota bacterium]
MSRQTINRMSAIALIVLALIAFSTVLSGYIFRVPSHGDEGTQAHIFQLSVAASMVALFVFATTADWKRPLKTATPIALQTVILLFSFLGLYLLEHP